MKINELRIERIDLEWTTDVAGRTASAANVCICSASVHGSVLLTLGETSSRVPVAFALVQSEMHQICQLVESIRQRLESEAPNA